MENKETLVEECEHLFYTKNKSTGVWKHTVFDKCKFCGLDLETWLEADDF